MKLGRASWCVLFLCLACDSGAGAPMFDLPARSDDAPGGAEIARDLRTLDFEAREERVYSEIVRGNIPSWLRQLERVDMTGTAGGRSHRVTFWATPDYLAVGSDSDYFLVPLSPGMAQRIADLVGGSLPTTRMVDAVWASAQVRLAPIRIRPDEHMRTVRYMERHNRLVHAQRELYRVPQGALLAGHKLDVVLYSKAAGEPAMAAIYGWHRRDGEPIQSPFPISMDRQPHYSVGIRLVYRGILIDGARESLSEILRDPELSPLLSGETMIARIAPEAR